MKVCRIGTIDTGNGRRASVYIKACNQNGHLSISGVIGPLLSGNALGGCGQIDMEFNHKDKSQNDARYGDLILAGDIHYAPGWDIHQWYKLLDIWHVWHLKNDVPQDIIDFINNLPDTDKTPAWV